MTRFEFDLGCNLRIVARGRVPAGRPAMILSGGFGIFDFDEPVQLALVDQLGRLGVGWLQYLYVERGPAAPTTDLLISSGIAALSRACREVVALGAAGVGLFGISFGANISLEVAALEPPGLVLLVNPVIDYVHYRSRQLGVDQMRAWASAGSIDLPYADRLVRSGYRFIEEAQAQDLRARLATVRAPVIACQAADDAILGTSFAEHLAATVPDCTLHIVAGADHTFAGAEAVGGFVELVRDRLAAWAANRT